MSLYSPIIPYLACTPIKLYTKDTLFLWGMPHNPRRLDFGKSKKV